MKTFLEWIFGFEDVFPEKPIPLNNPENKRTMFRIERWTKYDKSENDLDGGDIFFFDTWEEAKEWMSDDYFFHSGGWNMSKEERIEFNKEHGVFYKAQEEFGDAEAHSEWGY